MSLPHASPSDALGSLDVSEAEAGEDLAPETLEGPSATGWTSTSTETGPPFPDTLDLKGTDFQRRAWEAARAIPWGETRSYRWIAVQMGRPGAAQSRRARRCGPTRRQLLCPCHRVIGENGELRGYGGPEGIGMKKDLLAIERGNEHI